MEECCKERKIAELSGYDLQEECEKEEFVNLQEESEEGTCIIDGKLPKPKKGWVLSGRSCEELLYLQEERVKY